MSELENNNIITKELLNKNRVLTMSNNRKCNYLIVDVGMNKSATMVGINTQGNSKDILVIKEFINNTYDELVDKAYWLCREHDIQIVLCDKMGCGLGFIEVFNDKIDPRNATIRSC